MNMKRLALLKRVVDQSQLELVAGGRDGARIYAVVQAQNGKTLRVSLTYREGDIRGDLNETARIKRFARENNIQDIPTIQSLTTEDITMPRKLKAVDSTTPEALAKVSESGEQLTLSPELEAAAAPARNASKKGVRINRMTQAQFYALVEFIKTLDPLTFANNDVLAKHAAQALDLKVSDSSIAEALKILGKSTRYAMSRGEGKTRALTAINILARSLVALFEHLGEQVPADLRKLVK